MSDIEKIHGITPDLTKENVDRLLALFPDVATEITDPKTGKNRTRGGLRRAERATW